MSSWAEDLQNGNMNYKITNQGWSELKVWQVKFAFPMKKYYCTTLHSAPWQWKQRETRETICCGEMTTSMQIPGCTRISTYRLARAVLIFLYAWSALDISCLLTDPGSLVQTEKTQSVELSIQCLWLVEIMHTVENSAEGTISLYRSISLISTPSPICSFT